MLSKIDTLIRDEFKGNNILLDLSVLIQKHFKHENVSETEDFLYRKDNDRNVQRFIAVCFIRLVANNNYVHIETNKHQIFKHIIESIPDVCSLMGITDKTETYKKEIAIRDFILEREKEYKSYLIFKGYLNGLS